MPAASPTIRYPYRVFISYAHGDQPLAGRVADVLEAAGLIPVWDRHLPTGVEFTDEIKRTIATSHLFMPLLTLRSADRHWVQQEIGFAAGIDVPVVPVALVSLPDGMIAGLQALAVDDDLAGLSEMLQAVPFDRLVTPAEPSGLQRLRVASQVAQSPGHRARLVVEYLDQVRGTGRIRERALFSSFSLPGGGPYDPAWEPFRRPGVVDPDTRESLSRQRQILGTHARSAGCSLILSPTVGHSPASDPAHREQLAQLLAFLRSMPANLVTVAFSDGGMPGNLLLVGDWMCVTAPPPSPGGEYLGSYVTCHAPTVLRWLRHFDLELASKLTVPPDRSRDAAVERLQALLDRPAGG